MQACNYVKGRNHCRKNANDSFGKGFCQTPPPPEAHMIKYARGGAIHRIELYGRSFTRYFSELGSIFKKAPHLRL